jgi:hypothetical protein
MALKATKESAPGTALMIVATMQRVFKLHVILMYIRTYRSKPLLYSLG